MPLSPSQLLGVGHSFTAMPNVRPNPLPFFLCALHRSRRSRYFSKSFISKLLALAVGHNPDSLPDVRRIDGTSRNNKRLDFVTETFQ